MAHQRQRQEPEKCLYIQKNFRSSIKRLDCIPRGWRRAKANTNDQFTPTERRQRESPQPQTDYRIQFHPAQFFMMERFQRLGSLAQTDLE